MYHRRQRTSARSPVPATEPVRIWHLLTHTSGLTYGFHRVHPVDAMYRAAGFELGVAARGDLAEACDTWAGLPLLFEPGAEWNYSVATDVLGRVVEVASGQTLDEFFAASDLRPARHDRHRVLRRRRRRPGRLAALYTPGAEQQGGPARCPGRRPRKPPAMLSGGGGLVSTAADYNRFLQMLLHRADSPAGELDGVAAAQPPHGRLHGPQPPARQPGPGRSSAAR